MNRNQYLTGKRKSQQKFDKKMNKLSKTGIKLKRDTTRARVLSSLKRKHEPMTATQLSEGLSVRLDSLSSLLRRMCKSGVIETVPDIGPRGGVGYQLPPF